MPIGKFFIAKIKALPIAGQPFLAPISLKRFQDKWIPVIRPETRQNKDLEPGFDSIKTEKALNKIQQDKVSPCISHKHKCSSFVPSWP